jgi:ribosomal protein S18 acetylase RimI-like enzyme
MASIDIVEADLANVEHCDAVLALVEGYASGPMGGNQPLSNDVCERLIPALRNQPQRLVLLARMENRYIGVAVSFQGFSTFHARPLLNIHDLAVHPDFQQRGVGRRLLAEIEKIARERDCCRVTLEVLEQNDVARRLYRSLGFRGDGVQGEANYFLIKTL